MDRVSLPTIAGSLKPWVGVDIPFATVLADTVLNAAAMSVLVAAPGPGQIQAQVRYSGGAILTLAFGLNEKYASTAWAAGVSSGTQLLLRITELNGDFGEPSDFSGSIGFDADVLLTSIDRVKEFRGITDTDHDAMLYEIVEAVSRNIEGYVGRPLLQRQFDAERYRGAGARELVLNGFPVIGTPSVRLSGQDLAAGTDYQWNAANGIVERLVGDEDSTTVWPLDAAIEVDSVRGYATVPADIRLAATKQAVHEFAQARAGGGRLGLIGTTPERGGAAQYQAGGFLPEVLQVLDRYREVRAPWPG